MKKLGLLLAVFMVLCLVLGSVGCGDEGGQEVDVLKIGAVLHLSGYLGTVGTQTAAGMKFVADEINAAGGIKSLGGATLEVKVVDDKADPTTTAAEVERLINEEGVAAVFLGSDEMCQALAAPLADTHQVPILATGSYDSAVTAKGYDYYWAGASSSSYPGIAQAFAHYIDLLTDEYGKDPKTAAVLTYQAPDMLKGKAEIILPKLQEAGLTVVYDQTHTYGVSSWDSYALQLKQADADLFLAFTDPYSQADLLKALDRLNYMPDQGLWLGLNWDSYMQMIGADVAGRTIGLPGQFTTCSMVYATGYEVAQDFRTKYEAVNGEGSYGLAIVGAQAMYLLMAAVDKAKSADPVAINDALAEVEIAEGDADLVMPNFAPVLKFTETHEPVDQGYYIAQWQDGVCHVVRPEKFATADARVG